MYGKIFASLYTGSLVGSGAMVFSVWAYVIANQQPFGWLKNNPGEREMRVELNTRILAAILGEKEADVEEAIKTLCAPDKRSRSIEEEGRRLIKIDEFQYRVVNGWKYTRIRNNEDRREQLRLSQARRREKLRQKAAKASKPLPGESTYQRILEERGREAADQWQARVTACEQVGGLDPEVAIKAMDGQPKPKRKDLYPGGEMNPLNDPLTEEEFDQAAKALQNPAFTQQSKDPT